MSKREWKRVAAARFCGYCGTDHMIQKGEPALFITIGQIKKPFVRCAECAGEQPPELPPLKTSGSDVPFAFEHIGAVAKKLRAEWMPYRDSE